MATSLTSLIVQRQVATISEVEQAISRQVMHGGDFVTNLLEVAPHTEVGVTMVFAESLGLPSAPPGRLPAPSSDILDRFEAREALAWGLFPLRSSGTMLVLAVADPLETEVLQEIIERTGLEPSLVASPAVRVREGIAAHYGVPLDARQLKLVQRLDAAEQARSSVRPAAMDAAESGSLEASIPASEPLVRAVPLSLPGGPAPSLDETPAYFAAGQDYASTTSEVDEAWSEVEPAAPAAEPSAEPVAPASPPGEAHAPAEATQLAPAPASAEPVLAEPAAAASTPAEPQSSAQPTEAAGPPPTVQLAPSAPMLDDSPRPPSVLDARALVDVVRREIEQRRKKSHRSARRRGPFSRAEAEAELEKATNLDGVVDVFFAFGSQFFEYTALFLIQGDMAEGRDAFGPGTDHLRVQAIGVSLELPSSLRDVRLAGRVLLSQLDQHELDRELRRDLGRVRASSGLAALVPLSVRSRVLAVLLGDDGEADVTLSSLGELLGLVSLAAARLERIAISRKRGGPPPEALRPQPGSVAALARALSLPVAEQPAPSSPSGPPGARTAPHLGVGAEQASSNLAFVATEPNFHAVHQPTPAAGTPSQRTQLALTPSVDVVVAEASPGPAPLRSRGFALDSPGAFPAVDEDEPMSGRPTLPGAWPEADAAWTELVEGRPTLLGDSPIEDSLPSRRAPVVERDARPSSSVPPRKASNHPPSFVPPIPREDDDVSGLVAAESHQSWSERPPELRHATPAPVPADELPHGQEGTYTVIQGRESRQPSEIGGDLQALLQRAARGGLDGEEALSELLLVAESQFPRLVAHFPGPLAVDRFRVRSELPAASDCGPLLKLLVMMRRAALPFMTVRSAMPDVDQRFWATHVLGELLFPEASNAVLPRLFDEDVGVRRVARRAAQALVTAGSPGEPLRASLAHTIRSAEEANQRRVLAIEALSEIRVAAVVPVLIDALGDPSESIVEAARAGLIMVTRQDLGRSRDVWRAWWQLHHHEHRIEWLVNALTHESAPLRRAAGDELKHVTHEYFGYYDDLPAEERERVQALYRQWWADEGQFRFR